MLASREIFDYRAGIGAPRSGDLPRASLTLASTPPLFLHFSGKLTGLNGHFFLLGNSSKVYYYATHSTSLTTRVALFVH